MAYSGLQRELTGRLRSGWTVDQILETHVCMDGVC